MLVRSTRDPGPSNVGAQLAAEGQLRVLRHEMTVDVEVDLKPDCLPVNG